MPSRTTTKTDVSWPGELPLLTGLALASAISCFTATSLLHLYAAFVIGFLLSWKLRPASEKRKQSWTEVWSPYACLLFLLPLFTRASAPGLDTAMYAGLAEPFLSGRDELSPAWPGYSVDVYPRGFSSWIALGSPVLGLARATLLATTGSYLLFYFATRGFLRSLGSPAPSVVALLAIFLSKTPQSFFGWGGNPTIAATALTLTATTLLLSSSDEDRSRKMKAAGIAFLLFAGAAACHPVGAFSGALTLVVVPMRTMFGSFSGKPERQNPGPSILSVVLVGLGLVLIFLAIRIYGPEVSPSEHDWILHYQTDTEEIRRGPHWTLLLALLRGMPKFMGDPYTILFGLAVAVGLLRRIDRRVTTWTLLALTAVSAILFVGAKLPALELLIYPSRFSPLILVITLPVIAQLGAHAASHQKSITTVLAIALLLLGGIRHFAWYQSRPGLASADELEVIRCFGNTEQPRGLVGGPYLSGSQWIPALTGRGIEEPHIHISVRDEVRETLSEQKNRYQFVGSAHPEIPADAIEPPICRAGAAAIYSIR